MITLALLAALALASPAPGGGLRSLTFTAVDDKGQPVAGLTASDIALVQGGAALEVTEVVHEERPLTVAVLVDNSQPTSSALRLNVVPAVTTFLRHLPAGTRMAVWTTGDRPTKVADFTTESAVAARALQRVVPVGANRMLDAIVEASRELKKKEGERTAMVVVTGNGPGFTDYDRRHVVDIAREGGGALFESVVFDLAGPAAPLTSDPGTVGASDYDYVAGELAKSSGGRWERLLTSMALEGALAKVEADLSAQYRLTYRERPGGKGDLDAHVARPGVKLQLGASR